MTEKYKYLFKNMGWMTLSNFGAKVLVFLLVPFYTRVLTLEEYGAYDMVYTAVTLLAPLLTCNIAEALMRFSIAEKDNVAQSFSVSAVVSIVSIALSGLASIAIIAVWGQDAVWSSYILFGWVMLSASILYQLLSQFARGIDRVDVMAIGGLVNAALLVGLSLALVLGLHEGVAGYFAATSLSLLLAAGYMFFACRAWRYLTIPTRTSFRKLIAYGAPLGVNTLGWWANVALGRYVVAFACGVAGTGLLAAAYKIPSIPKIIQQIFVQAWQISSIKDFDKADGDGFFSSIYNVVCVLSSALTSLVIVFLPAIAWVMFSPEFYEAWRLVPLLMIGVLFDGLASVLGGVYAAAGDSRSLGVSAFASIVANLIACLALVPLLGVQGATVGSVVSSVAIWLFRLRGVRKHMDLRVDWRRMAACCALLGFQTAISLAWGEALFAFALQAPVVAILTWWSVRVVRGARKSC